jgi:hypothetical protein
VRTSWSGIGNETVELAFIVAVDHPAIGVGIHGRANARPEVVRSGLAPVRSVVESIQLDVGNPQTSGELTRERCLA